MKDLDALLQKPICIVVYIASKAIHLETVSDLSTQAFLVTFGRLIECKDVLYEFIAITEKISLELQNL